MKDAFNVKQKNTGVMFCVEKRIYKEEKSQPTIKQSFVHNETLWVKCLQAQKDTPVERIFKKDLICYYKSQKAFYNFVWRSLPLSVVFERTKENARKGKQWE